jgi:hypothetical protein
MILVGTALIAFVLGGLLVLVLVAFTNFYLIHPPINPLSSNFLANLLGKMEDLLANPWLGALILAGGIFASVWATRIAWQSLRENETRPEGSNPPGRNDLQS